MHNPRIIQYSAAPLILSTLLHRRQIQLPVENVLLVSAEVHTLARVLRKGCERVVSKQSSVCLPLRLTPPRNAHLLKDLPGFSPAASASPAVQVVTLTAEPVPLQQQQPLPPQRRADGEVIPLPLSLLNVADFYRAKHRERLPSSSRATTNAIIAGAPPFALIDGARVDAVQRDSIDLYCSPGSKDLMIVDAPALSNNEDLLWEALFVAECVLAEGGSLLALSPHPLPPRMQRFLQWRFRNAHCAAAVHGEGHYALCTALATDFGTSAVRRDDFPGLLARTRQRPRRWNPYRRQEARKFVVSVRPSFTNAPHTKDALLRNVAREKEREEQLRDADDAFFAVAHGMVERGTHYSQPND
jgi:hypothetical protein